MSSAKYKKHFSDLQQMRKCFKNDLPDKINCLGFKRVLLGVCV